MDYAEIKNKKEKQLHDLLETERKTLQDLQFQAAGRQLKNVRAIRVAKKTIARCLTALNVSTKDV